MFAGQSRPADLRKKRGLCWKLVAHYRATPWRLVADWRKLISHAPPDAGSDTGRIRPALAHEWDSQRTWGRVRLMWSLGATRADSGCSAFAPSTLTASQNARLRASPNVWPSTCARSFLPKSRDTQAGGPAGRSAAQRPSGARSGGQPNRWNRRSANRKRWTAIQPMDCNISPGRGAGNSRRAVARPTLPAPRRRRRPAVESGAPRTGHAGTAWPPARQPR